MTETLRRLPTVNLVGFLRIAGALAVRDTFRFTVTLKQLTTTAPFAAPVTATLTHARIIDRRGTTSACEDTGTGLRCREE
jgi:hypothetical protein